MQKRYCEFRFNFVTPCLQLLFLYCVLEEQEPSDWRYTKVAFPRIHEPWINAQAQWGMIWGSAYREEKLYTSEAYSMLQTNYVFCINILIAQSHDKNYNEGKREQAEPTQGATFMGKSKPWFITTLLVPSQRLIHNTLPGRTFPTCICRAPLPLPPSQGGHGPRGLLSHPLFLPSLAGVLYASKLKVICSRWRV